MKNAKDYIELLEMKNFKQSCIYFDGFHNEKGILEELNVYKTYISQNNSNVTAEVALCCEDILTLNEKITIEEDRLVKEDGYENEIDKQIDYTLFDCISINVYGEIMITDSLDECNNPDDIRGIGLRNQKYCKDVNPFYELTLKNLEHVLYIQDSENKTYHINFLLQNYLFYFDKIINPIITPFMETYGCVCKSDINLVLTNDYNAEDTRIKLTYIRKSEDEGINGQEVFSIFVDVLYGNLYGFIDDGEMKKYINLNEITRAELMNELSKDYIMQLYGDF